jgi:hypothetical protein
MFLSAELKMCKNELPNIINTGVEVLTAVITSGM